MVLLISYVSLLDYIRMPQDLSRIPVKALSPVPAADRDVLRPVPYSTPQITCSLSYMLLPSDCL